MMSTGSIQARGRAQDAQHRSDLAGTANRTHLYAAK
jgi:hypothetical protein